MCDDPKNDDCGGKDMLVPGPEIGNGFRTFSRHLPDHTIVEGVMRPLKHGEPIMSGEVLSVKPRKDGTPVCDVESIDIPGQSVCANCCHEESHKGPAKVTTRAYRSGWDRIFGGKPEVGQA